MNVFKGYNNDQLEDLFSNYLIDSWSYSKLASFSRNEKAFERSYIYNIKDTRSASSVAGNAYHEGLRMFFETLSTGQAMDISEALKTAYAHIDSVGADQWKIQKTTPTIESCKLTANKKASALLTNFYAESGVYLDEIKEVLAVEKKYVSFISVNGVDIPLPCHAIVDLLIKTMDDKIVIIDHKSKSTYTDEKDLVYTSGKQAMTYLLVVEEELNVKIDEVWFMENKISKNKDGSPQIRKCKIEFDDDTRKLYGALLYEPLKRMIEAVSDPDYVYLINDNDNFIDKAALYEFWAKTLISEVSEFDIQENKKEIIEKRTKKIRDATLSGINPKIITEFRKHAAAFISFNLNDNMTNSEKIEHVLRVFGVIVSVKHEILGYSSNTYLLEVSAGVKIANVAKYKLDIANAINVPNIRVGEDLMIYNGCSYLYFESPKKRDKDLLWDAKYLVDFKIPIGIDNFGRPIVWDLDNHSTPHMLMCGATGSGKSVSIYSTIAYAKLAGVKDIIVFDPKYEFLNLKQEGITVINEIEDIEKKMKDLVEEMKARTKTGLSDKKLVVFDEFADAVSAARSGSQLDIKEMVQIGEYAPKKFQPARPKMALKVVGHEKSLEENLKILLQKGRSLGFRIISATQRASTKIITGDAKVNFPVQICFRVPKEIDSKVVLDESGAELLSGAGDGLIHSPEYFELVRFQAFYKK